MTIDEIVSSSTGLANTAGTTLFKSLFGIAPTWLLYAIPLALITGVVSYFLVRSGLGGGHK